MEEGNEKIHYQEIGNGYNPICGLKNEYLIDKSDYKYKMSIGGNFVDVTCEKCLERKSGLTKEELYDKQVKDVKQLRKDTDEIIQRVKDLPHSREASLAITKLQEGVMWMGMCLKQLGEANPYPNSKDSSNTKIEPTADGLKL